MLQIRLSIAIHLVCVRCVLDTVRSCAKATCFSRSMARGCLSPSSIAADSHQAMRFIAWIAIINSSINRFVNSRRISILASVQMRRSLDTSKLRNSTTKLDAPKHNNERRQRKTTTKTTTKTTPTISRRLARLSKRLCNWHRYSRFR